MNIRHRIRISHSFDGQNVFQFIKEQDVKDVLVNLQLSPYEILRLDIVRSPVSLHDAVLALQLSQLIFSCIDKKMSFLFNSKIFSVQFVNQQLIHTVWK